MTAEESFSNHSEEYFRTLRIVTSLLSLLSCSVLFYLNTKRIPANVSEWKDLTLGKTWMILLLVVSWLFVLFAGLIVTVGAGARQDSVTCSLAFFGCLVFVGSTQVLASALFVEKVYIVWSNGFRTPRFQTLAFRICLLLQLGFVIVAVLAIKGRSSRIVGDGVCVIGFTDYAWISGIAFDCAQNGFYAFMFCWPLFKAKLRTPALRTVARKTLVGTISSMLTLGTNTFVLVILGGREVIWVCILISVLQVTINALVLYWVSSGAPSDSVDHFTLPTISRPTSTQPMNSPFTADSESRSASTKRTNESTVASEATQTLHARSRTVNLEQQRTIQNSDHCSVPPATWEDVCGVNAKPPPEPHKPRSDLATNTGDENTSI